jgi:hypothetical protein
MKLESKLMLDTNVYCICNTRLQPVNQELEHLTGTQ